MDDPNAVSGLVEQLRVLQDRVLCDEWSKSNDSLALLISHVETLASKVERVGQLCAALALQTGNPSTAAEIRKLF